MTFLKSLSVQVLVALLAGLGLGALAAAYGGAAATPMIEGVEALGGLWLNALRMTVVPLIFAVLVTGIAQVADAAATGRLAMKAVVWFLALLMVSAVTAVLLVNGILAAWPVGETASAALRAGAQAPPAGTPIAPDFAAWVKSLAPSNPIKAAAEDAILPVVVFAIFTGFALTRLPEGRGRTLLEVFNALGEAMIVIVRWVLMAAPLGVFALALGVGLRAGVGAAGILGHYVVTASLAGLAVGIIGYVLAVAVFRMTSPAVNLAVCIFVAKVYGLEPSALQYTGAVFVALAVSVGSVSLPGQVSFIVSVAPICVALGLPLDLLPILLAVEVVPDIFRTLGNVTGDMAVTAIVARDEPDDHPTSQA